jgi:DNA gyrase subunit B
MHELIERGHLFIAQPPLYKVTRGKSEQYLKDERAMEEYLITGGLEEAVLTLASGETRAGADLRAIVDAALQVRHILDGLHSRYHRGVVEQAAIAGALNPDLLSNDERGREAADYIARRLDLLSEETERGWTGRFDEARGLTFERTVRGVTEVQAIDSALLHSADARRLDQHAAHLQGIYLRPATLRRKDAETPIYGARDLLEAVFSTGRKGLTLQRYKGLGEMNPEQLWETTLDPNARSLLQVRRREGDDADDIFTKLMGDEVEPRRQFIQENALSVANLDV